MTITKTKVRDLIERVRCLREVCEDGGIMCRPGTGNTIDEIGKLLRELSATLPPSEFDTEHLDDAGKKLAAIVLKVLAKRFPKGYSSGGCRAFYTPAEWSDRGEHYGSNSVLVLVHDGGDLGALCNYDKLDYDSIEALSNALSEHGYFCENCTSWYSAIYKIKSIVKVG